MFLHGTKVGSFFLHLLVLEKDFFPIHLYKLVN
jgi:hypothetical protein